MFGEHAVRGAGDEGRRAGPLPPRRRPADRKGSHRTMARARRWPAAATAPGWSIGAAGTVQRRRSRDAGQRPGEAAGFGPAPPRRRRRRAGSSSSRRRRPRPTSSPTSRSEAAGVGEPGDALRRLVDRRARRRGQRHRRRPSTSSRTASPPPSRCRAAPACWRWRRWARGPDWSCCAATATRGELHRRRPRRPFRPAAGHHRGRRAGRRACPTRPATPCSSSTWTAGTVARHRPRQRQGVQRVPLGLPAVGAARRLRQGRAPVGQRRRRRPGRHHRGDGDSHPINKDDRGCPRPTPSSPRDSPARTPEPDPGPDSGAGPPAGGTSGPASVGLAARSPRRPSSPRRACPSSSPPGAATPA